MKIVIAPDSFKDALNAIDASKIILEAFKKINFNKSYYLAPISDGGEGLLNVLTKDMEDVVVKGPLGESLVAQIGFLDNKKTVVVEMALAAGLEKVEESKRDPFITTSYGVGQMLVKALNYNPSKIILGLGGSATNDLGLGALQALGVKFYNQNNCEVDIFGKDLFEVKKIDITKANKKLFNIEFILATDVNNPLLGLDGSTYVYGPQKGLKEKDKIKFDNQFKFVSNLLNEKCQTDLTKEKGSGAAGGLAFSMATVFKGKITSGFDVVYEQLKLKEILKEANILITGEGKTDKQTLSGKAPYLITQKAKMINKNIKVYSFVGTNLLKEESIFDEIIEINSPNFSLKENIINTKKHLKEQATKLANKLL